MANDHDATPGTTADEYVNLVDDLQKHALDLLTLQSEQSQRTTRLSHLRARLTNLVGTSEENKPQKVIIPVDHRAVLVQFYERGTPEGS